MAGVQLLAPALNDENSSLQVPGQLKSAAPLQASKQQGSVLKSARKAFGNITNNTQPKGGSDASNSKSTKQQQPARRAFGDITNSAAKPPAGLSATTAKKAAGSSSVFARPLPTGPTFPDKQAVLSRLAPDAGPAADSSRTNSSTTAAAAVQASTHAEWWQGLEVERPAGKTWEQLESEREAAEEADALQEADEVWRLAGQQRMNVLQPVATPPDSDDEDMLASLATPTRDALPNFAAAVLDVLPDIPFEELVFAADTDFASWLPDIAPPSDEETEDSSIGEAAAAADEADVGLAAAVAHVCIHAQGGTAACSSPVSSLVTQQLDQQQALDCKSPMGMPW